MAAKKYETIKVEKADGELRNVEFVTFSNVKDPRVAAK